MDKYYTPDITDFRIGYEFEALSFRGDYWQVSNLYEEDFWADRMGDSVYQDIVRDLKDGRIRTKYLTKEDIESLGWKLDKNESYYKFDTDTQYTLRYHFESKRLIIEDEIGEDTLFRGTIKSINELKYLSKLLNIE